MTGVNSLPKTVSRQRRGCDLNPGPSAHESSMLTTWLPSDSIMNRRRKFIDGLIHSERYNVVLKVMGAKVLHK